MESAMERDADKAIEMIREVDSLREEVSRKLRAANEQLDSLRDRAAVYREIIKSNYNIFSAMAAQASASARA